VLNSPLVRRGRIVAVNAARHLMVPLENLGAAWLVVVFLDADAVWGAFVGTQIVVGLTVHVLSWGNKDWLLRRASGAPAELGHSWQRALWARARFLPVAALIVIFLGHDRETIAWVLVWIGAAFVAQSMDAPILIARRFKTAIAVEMMAFATVIMLLVVPSDVGVSAVIRAWAVGALVRAVLLLVALLNKLGPCCRLEAEPGYLISAAPFFLLGLSGMLQSKMDLYMATLILDDGAVGRYQVIINTFIMLQAGAAFLVMPFAKTLYRVNDIVAAAFARSVWLLGLGITAVGTGGAWLLLNRVYHFDLGWSWFVLGAMLVVPIFGYAPRVYRLFGAGRERAVVIISLVGAGINFVISLVLLQIVGALGALIGSVVAHWVTLAIILGLEVEVDDGGSQS
jgi:O-antigen/teichoic acid export membrane protein